MTGGIYGCCRDGRVSIVEVIISFLFLVDTEDFRFFRAGGVFFELADWI